MDTGNNRSTIEPGDGCEAYRISKPRRFASAVPLIPAFRTATRVVTIHRRTAGQPRSAHACHREQGRMQRLQVV